MSETVETAAPVEPGAAAVVPESTPAAVETTSPAVEAAGEAPAPSSLLHEHDKEVAAAAEPPREPTAEKAEAPPTETPAETPAPEPIAYEDFVMPEGVKPSTEQMAEFKALLAEQRLPQEAGQRLVDLYGKNAAAYAEHLQAEQHRIFNETRREWRTAAMADDEIGGSGFRTAMAQVAQARDRIFPDKAERDAFMAAMEYSGMGDNPIFLKFMARVGRRIGEPSVPPQAQTPPPTNGRPPGRMALREIYAATRTG